MKNDFFHKNFTSSSFSFINNFALFSEMRTMITVLEQGLANAQNGQLFMSNVPQFVQKSTTMYHKAQQMTTMQHNVPQRTTMCTARYQNMPKSPQLTTYHNERIIKSKNKNFRLLRDHVTCIVFSRTLFTHEPFPIITVRDKMLCLNQNEKIKLT